MGKPFAKELEKIDETLEWALTLDVEALAKDVLENANFPLFIVGSGGSLSACYYAAYLYQGLGIMAKAITPLDLFYNKHAIRKSNILFISASGRNTDILFGYKTAIKFEPNKIFSICMKGNSPLAKIARDVSIGAHYEYDNPAKKDGFLATNSLVAFFALLYRIFNLRATLSLQNPHVVPGLETFVSRIQPDYTFTVLYAGLGQPVAMDLESKLAEAALGDILISDYRNFGHGRHHWFAKRANNSAIIALITPDEKELAIKTLSLIPKEIPVLIIDSNLKNAGASIELLIKSFHFIDKLGNIQGIDPGRPGVPDFGSKLYHLKYQKIYESSSKVKDVEVAIVRKADISHFDSLSNHDKEYWLDAYKNFTFNLTNTEFGSLIFDYDGTLCSAANRFIGLDLATTDYLVKFLEKGITIGIATGRGKSVRSALQASIPQKYWNQVVIGYYNCSDIGTLSDNDLPNKNLPNNPTLEKIYKGIIDQRFPADIEPELKPHQIVIEVKKLEEWKKVRASIIQFIVSLNLNNIQILESSHSMDIIDPTQSSKLDILPFCAEIAVKSGKTSHCLCFGDKGKWPGNDYQLLSHNYSLSVDEVSPLINSGWNLAKPGIKNVDAMLYYLSCLYLTDIGLSYKL